MHYDVVVLTDDRYIDPKQKDIYVSNILEEDHLVMDALAQLGLKVVRKSWADPHFDWSCTKYALFRTTWDYFDRYTEFYEWFKKTSGLTQFINSKQLIDWNIDKHYLRDLNEQGINIPNTHFIESGDPLSLKEAIEKADKTFGFECKDFVLKPCISGAARHTYKFNRFNWTQHDAVFKQLISKESMMLQEFQQNILDEGEISLMIFNGEYTHGVLKVAKPGDFRVQDDFGGSVHPYQASEIQIKFAKKVVKAAPEIPTYARVDIFRDNGGNWALAELEIFEPELWFRLESSAAQTLAKAIKHKYFS
ncbi:hypothetical protein GTQ34_02940 [Muricauda sp. JGD-17]|uniref:ATP-grasp fold RimK-type domain-containing protein n=1 Tax=Flagellimonas ochracea TaxID=2696472 RepID=A0A964WWS4_9FLAO|nr:hypothetical protein [Allomuricauda ochracea]NAY90864.1 hypothetical protein [Allomuricauda ochracea]